MNPGRGIALKIASTVVFTLMLVCVKAVTGRIPPGEIVFARSFFAIIPIACMLLWQGEIVAALRTERPWRHVTRGIMGLLAMASGFVSLRYLPLPEQMAIGYASPIIVVALAAIVLGETVRIYRWSAVAIGFVGVVVILWPRFTLFMEGRSQGLALFGAVIALFGAFCGANAAIAIRVDDAHGNDCEHRALFRAERFGAVAASRCRSAGCCRARPRRRCSSPSGCWAGSGRS